MKRIHFVFIVLIFFVHPLFAQFTNDSWCTSPVAHGLSKSALIPASVGGLYKPSSSASGEYMRTLIVYVQFADDNSSVPNWTKNSLPTWAYDIIDSIQMTTYKSYTLSDYFRQMS